MRFTAFHSAVRVSLHPTGVARISLSVCCELGWRGSNNVRKAYRGVECTPPAPPCGNVGQVPCFCDTEAFLAYSKPDHVSNVSHLFVLGDLHWLVIVVLVGFAFVIGPGEEKVRMIAMF